MERRTVESRPSSRDPVKGITTYWRVRMSGTDKDLRKFLSVYPNEPSRIQRDGDVVTFEVLLPESLVDLLESIRRLAEVKRGENATETGLKMIRMQEELARRAPYDRKIPRGLGLKKG